MFLEAMVFSRVTVLISHEIQILKEQNIAHFQHFLSLTHTRYTFFLFFAPFFFFFSLDFLFCWHFLLLHGLFLICVGEVWKLHRKLMSPSLKDSTVFSHLSIFNFYIREFCNVTLDEEAKMGKAFDVMLPLNVCLLSMYLDATLGIEWHQKSTYANFFSE